VGVLDNLDPELQERFSSGGGELTRKMGIELLEISAERTVGRMPVEGNRQVVGILHGGAHVVLGETLGSVAAAVHAGAGRYAVGIDINATHTKSIADGWATGTCTAISLGKTICVHEIIVTNDAGERLSTVRITNLLRDR
jgi:uncharacterized protein (TIGR00369 family)